MNIIVGQNTKLKQIDGYWY